MSSYSDTLEALSKAATARPWYPKPNDLIGGWAVMNCDQSPANADFGKGDLEVADFTDAPHARFIASLANHADDFVRLLRAAERKVTNDPRRCSELAEALAAFEEKQG